MQNEPKGKNMGKDPSRFEDSASEAVSPTVRFAPWPVYRGYDVHRLDGDAYVVGRRGTRQHRRENWDLYSPLKDKPELFLEFAELADREIDEEAWRDWWTRNGVLGLGGSTPYLAAAGGGPEETFSGFVEEARIANAVLRLWEAAHAGIGDEEFLDRYLPQYTLLQDRAKGLFGVWSMDVPRKATAPWLAMVGPHVQRRLTTECYPLLVGAHNPPFDRAFGFRSLLGAMYLQMYWLMTATGEVRVCKRLGCHRVITFDQPKQLRDFWKFNDRSRGYKTRRDKVFCSPACKQRDYDRRKRRSRG
jgi:hypothetical protein